MRIFAAILFLLALTSCESSAKAEPVKMETKWPQPTAWIVSSGKLMYFEHEAEAKAYAGDHGFDYVGISTREPAIEGRDSALGSEASKSSVWITGSPPCFGETELHAFASEADAYAFAKSEEHGGREQGWRVASIPIR